MSLLRRCDTRYTQLPASRVQQCLAAGFKRGSRGDNIIDQKHTLVSNRRRVDDLKNPADVFPSAQLTFMRLSFRLSGSPHIVIIAWYLQHLRQPLPEFLALIIPSDRPPGNVQRYRNNKVK